MKFTCDVFDYFIIFKNDIMKLCIKQSYVSSDIIIRVDGLKVLPLPIERRVLDQMPCLSHCVVVGEGRDFVSALLVFKVG